MTVRREGRGSEGVSVGPPGEALALTAGDLARALAGLVARGGQGMTGVGRAEGEGVICAALAPIEGTMPAPMQTRDAECCGRMTS